MLYNSRCCWNETRPLDFCPHYTENQQSCLRDTRAYCRTQFSWKENNFAEFLDEVRVKINQDFVQSSVAFHYCNICYWGAPRGSERAWRQLPWWRSSNRRCCCNETPPTTEWNLDFLLPAHLGNQQSLQENFVRRMLYETQTCINKKCMLIAQHGCLSPCYSTHY